MFTITGMTVDGNNNVVSLDWCYENSDGKLSNTWKLLTPEGSTPLAQVTETLAVTWLVAQLPNTTAEFDTAIADAKAAFDYQQTLVSYEKINSGTFSLVNNGTSNQTSSSGSSY